MQKGRWLGNGSDNRESAIKNAFGKSFGIPLDLDFFKHPVYPYGYKEDVIVRLELNSSEKVFYALEMPLQRTSSQTYRWNMMRVLTSLIPQL